MASKTEKQHGVITCAGLRVVDSNGVERITLEVAGGEARVKVEAVGPDDKLNDSNVALWGSDEGCVAFTVMEGGNFSQWLDGSGLRDDREGHQSDIEARDAELACLAKEVAHLRDLIETHLRTCPQAARLSDPS